VVASTACRWSGFPCVAFVARSASPSQRYGLFSSSALRPYLIIPTSNLSAISSMMIQRLAGAAAELSRLVQMNAHKQWIWLAIDAKSRWVIALHVGDRSRRRARRLWAKMPEAYRQHATFSTDQYVVYEGLLSAAPHRALTQLAQKTNHIERFTNTLHQRVSRPVRGANIAWLLPFPEGGFYGNLLKLRL
jgi:insertion element IS1 protein InsB